MRAVFDTFMRFRTIEGCCSSSLRGLDCAPSVPQGAGHSNRHILAFVMLAICLLHRLTRRVTFLRTARPTSSMYSPGTSESGVCRLQIDKQSALLLQMHRNIRDDRPSKLTRDTMPWERRMRVQQCHTMNCYSENLQLTSRKLQQQSIPNSTCRCPRHLLIYSSNINATEI